MNIKIVIRSVVIVISCGLSVPHISGMNYPIISTIGTILKWTLAAGPTYLAQSAGLKGLAEYKRNPEKMFEGLKVKKELTDAEQWFMDVLKEDGFNETPIHITENTSISKMLGGAFTLDKEIFISEHPAFMEESLDDTIKSNDMSKRNEVIAVLEHEKKHATDYHMRKRIAWSLSTPLLTGSALTILKKTLVPIRMVGKFGPLGILASSIIAGTGLCASNFYLQSKLEQHHEYEADAAVDYLYIPGMARYLDKMEDYAKQNGIAVLDDIDKQHLKACEKKNIVSHVISHGVFCIGLVKASLSHPSPEDRKLALSKRQHDELVKLGMVKPENYKPGLFYQYEHGLAQAESQDKTIELQDLRIVSGLTHSMKVLIGTCKK